MGDMEKPLESMLCPDNKPASTQKQFKQLFQGYSLSLN